MYSLHRSSNRSHILVVLNNPTQAPRALPQRNSLFRIDKRVCGLILSQKQRATHSSDDWFIEQLLYFLASFIFMKGCICCDIARADLTYRFARFCQYHQVFPKPFHNRIKPRLWAVAASASASPARAVTITARTFLLPWPPFDWELPLVAGMSLSEGFF